MADPETPLTTDTLGRVVGLRKRATQNHLAHLFAKSRIDADRRTPLVSGIGQPLLPGAQEWAANIVSPDPTCARCLIALAYFGWEGQVKMEELAKAAGVSLRTVERHRPHLVKADLVSFVPVPVHGSDGKNYGRRADRFRLLSGFPAARLAGPAWAEAPDRAEEILARVRWFAGVERDGDEWAAAVQSVTWCLRNGWPSNALLHALDASENRQAYNPRGYLTKLLRKLPREYILPAQDVASGRTEPRMTECPVCQAPFRTRLPGSPQCGGGYCLAAGRDAAPAASIFKIA